MIDPNSQQSATNIVSNLDYNEDKATSYGSIGDKDGLQDDHIEGFLQLYLKTVVERLSEELNPKNKKTDCTWNNLPTRKFLGG